MFQLFSFFVIHDEKSLNSEIKIFEEFLHITWSTWSIWEKKVFLFIVQSVEDACKKQHSMHNFDPIQERMIEYANDTVTFQSIDEKLWKFLFFLNIKKSDEINFYIEVMLTLKNNVQLLKDVLFSFKRKQKWTNWNKYLRRNSMYRPFSIDLNKCINTVVYEAIYIFLLQTYSIRSLCYKNRQ